MGNVIGLTDAYLLEGCAGLSQFSNRLKAVMTPGAKLVLLYFLCVDACPRRIAGICDSKQKEMLMRCSVY